MTDQASDGHIDRLVKARWLAVGLSQSDLAEVLGAVIRPGGEDSGGSDSIAPARLTEIAEALELPVGLLDYGGVGTAPSPGQEFEPLQGLLDLRMLRAFRNLRDLRTKRLLVQLAEQLMKRQLNRDDRGG